MRAALAALFLLVPPAFSEGTRSVEPRAPTTPPPPGVEQAYEIQDTLRGIQADLQSMADPIVQTREKHAVTRAVSLRLSVDLIHLSDKTLALGEKQPHTPQAEKARKAFEAATLSARSLYAETADPAAAQKLLDALEAVESRGDEYLRAFASSQASAQRTVAEAAMNAHMKDLEARFPEQAARLKAAFESRDPGTIDAALAQMRGTGDGGTGTPAPGFSDALRRYAYLERLMSPPPARKPLDRADIPAPTDAPVRPWKPIADLGGKKDQVRNATLAALETIPALNDWAAPRRKDVVERLCALKADGTQPQADERGFVDGFGQPMSYEEVADRFLLARCASEKPADAAQQFLMYTVFSRGHTEKDPETAWEWIRRGALLDTEGHRWSPGQKRTSSIDGRVTVTGDYMTWSDLDHFSQSLEGAAHWDGDAVIPVLQAAGMRSTADSLDRTFGADSWSGTAAAEWMTSLQNAGWTAAKAVGIVAGSKPDWKQFDASERGTRYAAALRRNLKKTKGDFCGAVRLRTGAKAPEPRVQAREPAARSEPEAGADLVAPDGAEGDGAP